MIVFKSGAYVNHMTMSALIVECQRDDIALVFTFQCATFSTQIQYYTPTMCSPQQWQELFDGKDCELIFCAVDSMVSIVQKDAKVIFDIGTYGNGGDGDACVTVDASWCTEAFIQCKQILQEMYQAY